MKINWRPRKREPKPKKSEETKEAERLKRLAKKRK